MDLDLILNEEDTIKSHTYISENSKGELISCKLKYCDCKFRECRCNNQHNLTKSIVKELLNYYGMSDIQKNIDRGVRLDCLHLWGTANLSREGIEEWLKDYLPISIEWINDYSCNLKFTTATVCFLLLKKLSVECDTSKEDIEGETVCTWRSFKSLPPKTTRLLIRFANSRDVKLRGSRKRSEYYKKYGHPIPTDDRVEQHQERLNIARQLKKVADQVIEEELHKSVKSDHIVGYSDLPRLIDQDSRKPEQKQADQARIEVIIISSPESKENTKRGRPLLPTLSNNLYDRDSDSDNESPRKRRKMLTSLKLYSDQIIEGNSLFERREEQKLRLSKSIKKRLG